MTGNSLNVYSQIGLISLVGLISKNGILITEFANQLQEAGRPKFETNPGLSTVEGYGLATALRANRPSERASLACTIRSMA